MHFPERRMMDLNGIWQFAYTTEVESEVGFSSLASVKEAGLPVHPCTVPGNFELDLQGLGVLEDPHYGANIYQLQPYEEATVWYGRSFSVEHMPPETQALLTFGGIDCCATVYLNGVKLGECDNMLVEQVFDVTALLKAENELFLQIDPSLHAAKRYDYPPLVAAFAPNYDGLYVRKAPHMYGWDIMPRALSAGLWRPVTLQFVPREHIDSLYLVTRELGPQGEQATLSLHYRLQTQGTAADRYVLEVEGRCGESEFSGCVPVYSDAGEHVIRLEQPKLWWPAGYGEANLYEVAVCLKKNGEVVDQAAFRHGVRTAELRRTSTTTPEGTGEFCFFVNGERVFAKGTNWVPADAFHSRDAARIEPILDLAVELQCNIIRCWGGNVYEEDRFFDLCDERGLMVWQDFAMACAVYPQDEEFCRRLAAEARAVVKRLRQHPCLVLWAGDNECDIFYAMFHRGNPNHNVLTRRVLPEVVREEDGARPYLPSSPYLDETAYQTGEHALPEDHLWGPRAPSSPPAEETASPGAENGPPEDHLWGPRDYYKSRYYRTAAAHFASEIGSHGCPDPESIRRFISPAWVWPYQNNPEWIIHATSTVEGFTLFDYRIELMVNQVRTLFGQVPETLEDFAFASQASQAEANKTFIEIYRGTKWRRTGIIWWNLIDGWPQFSDAVVDYYFRTKLAYHVIARSQQHLCGLLLEPEHGQQRLVAANDTLREYALSYRVTDLDTDEVMASGEAVAAANRVTSLAEIPFEDDRQRCFLITWESELGPGRNHYLAGSPPFSLDRYRGWMEKTGLLAEKTARRDD